MTRARPSPCTVLLAPDAFTGFLGAMEICDLLEAAVRDWWRERRPDHPLRVLRAPMADGGTGTLDVLAAAHGGTRVEVPGVRDPLGGPITAPYLRLPDGGAFIAMSTASGIERVLEPRDRRDPLRTSTYGTGQLLRRAVEDGVPRLGLGLGGSATNDGGAGALQALGVRFRDARGAELSAGLGGGDLDRIAALDPARALSLEGVAVQIACDVDNPLLGPEGATYTYGPQKGGTPAVLDRLEANLTRYADLLEAWVQDHRPDRGAVLGRHFPDSTGHRFRDIPGLGAAGGLGYGLACLYPVTLAPGARLVAEMVHLKALADQADLVITGEGKIDGQSLRGKVIQVVAEIAAAARDRGARVTAIGGSLGDDVAPAALARWFDRVEDASEGRPLDWEAIRREGAANLRRAVGRLLESLD